MTYINMAVSRNEKKFSMRKKNFYFEKSVTQRTVLQQKKILLVFKEFALRN